MPTAIEPPVMPWTAEQEDQLLRRISVILAPGDRHDLRSHANAVLVAFPNAPAIHRQFLEYLAGAAESPPASVANVGADFRS